MSEDLIEYLDDAVKKEFNQLLELYERTDDIDSLMRLMHTDNLTEIIANALTKLGAVGINIFKQNYSSQYDCLSNQAKQQLMPSIDMEKKLLSFISSDNEAIILTLNNYTDRYQSMIDFLYKAKIDSDSNSFGGGIIGGAIAGLAFGPIGAIIGGIAAGSYVGERSRVDSQADFKVLFQALTTEFGNTMDDLDTFLDEMVDRLIAATENYEESLLMQRRIS